MRPLSSLFLALLLAVFSSVAWAQTPALNPELQTGPWTASWIAHPDDSGREVGVYHFRKSIQVDHVPDRFVVHVSADNRYRLFVNGTAVSSGPARGDLFNWRFESVDLAPFLVSGTNVLSAVVWNFAEHRPMAQHSHRTAFLIQGDTQIERISDTDSSWVVVRNGGHGIIPVNREALGWVYIVVGPGEKIDAAQYPWGWETPLFDASRWVPAVPVRNAVMHWGRIYGEIYGWRLTPRAIPAMEETPISFARIRRSIGVDGRSFLPGHDPLIIPANTTASILFDQDHLVTAYPELLVSGGAGSRVTATYAEALFDSAGRKGNRDVVEGKSIRGIYDVFIPDGGEMRLFRPLWFRTYRYAQLDIRTASEPLVIRDYRGVFTAYPFEERGRFESSDPTLAKIWEVGWRTARLCAGETYYDCPYYEQLQYAGDTRIQALISLYVSGDDRLMRQAIEAFDQSRLADGLTQSRYPSYDAQIIPPYSLFWIVMIHDFWMHRNDPAFVEPLLTGVRGVIDWYASHLDETGLLGPTPWWNFVDWSFPRGVPSGADEGHSSIVALQFAYALDRAEEMARAFGRADEADHYLTLSTRVKDAVHRLCWDPSRGLVADTPAREEFSQHASIMAVLVDAVRDQKSVMERVIEDTSLTQVTYYYRFYLDEAARKAGLAETYTDRLEPWTAMLDLGLTTFAEEPDPTRSDSHAWSSSPNYHFLSLVAGIRPGSAGFGTVRMEPALGRLDWVRGRVPHPDGEIAFDLRDDGGRLLGFVTLPEGITGSLSWKGAEKHLSTGRTEVRVVP